mmetsp:Transcript_127571/g.220602  ORF Transcript_127571/g.220602 Transcript_127571/m.220602 type:complete len:95 (-) Transcript_127571:646-930(-)
MRASGTIRAPASSKEWLCNKQLPQRVDPAVNLLVGFINIRIPSVLKLSCTQRGQAGTALVVGPRAEAEMPEGGNLSKCWAKTPVFLASARTTKS